MPLSDSEALKCELLGALETCPSPLRTHKWPFRLGLSWDGSTGHVIAEARPPEFDEALLLTARRVSACNCVDSDEERNQCEYCASQAACSRASGSVNRGMLAATTDGLTLRGPEVHHAEARTNIYKPNRGNCVGVPLSAGGMTCYKVWRTNPKLSANLQQLVGLATRLDIVQIAASGEMLRKQLCALVASNRMDWFTICFCLGDASPMSLVYSTSDSGLFSK
jgi:hypothetical protein